MALQKLTMTALFMAIGVLSAHIVYVPLGVAKCFPVQHTINVLVSVFLGMRYSLSAAFGIAVVRNLAGTGSLLAFPGSIFGAALSGFIYQKTNSIVGAIIGEMIGTGLVGGLVAVPLAKYILGTTVGAFFFVVPFLISAAGGSLIAYVIYLTPITALFRAKFGE